MLCKYLMLFIAYLQFFHIISFASVVIMNVLLLLLLAAL